MKLNYLGLLIILCLDSTLLSFYQISSKMQTPVSIYLRNCTVRLECFYKNQTFHCVTPE